MTTELPSLAPALLDAGELAAYGRLFEHLAGVEDPLRAQWGAERLAAAGLDACAAIAAERRGELLELIVAGALGCLEREPSEPLLLRDCSRAMAELERGEGCAAGELMAAALRLDPLLEHAEPRAAGGGIAAHSGPPRERVAALGARARAVAACAVPAEGLRLSLCMIVRDEQDTLGRCLESIADAVEEIVVVDTGSTDATIAIARSFGAQVIERPWTGSFAAARNVAFDAAEGDWLVYLDADEVLVEGDGPLLRSLTGRTWREAFYVCERSHTGEPGDGTSVIHDAMRVFRNRPHYRFTGRVHEQIAHRLPAYLPERVEQTAVRIEHFGYLAAVREERKKSRRNIELLRMQASETPSDPFLHFNLGSEYAAAGDAAAALAELELAWAALDTRPESETREFGPTLAARLVGSMRECGRPREAIARAERALERFPGFTDLVLEQAFAAIALGDEDAARTLLERCVAMGDAPRRFAPRAGAGSYLPRVLLAERLLLAGELDEARVLLEVCLRESPQFAGSVAPYARVLLAGGMTGEDVLSEIERRIPEPSPAACAALGEVLLAVGATAAAETQFRAALLAAPEGGRARAGLGEALMLQRRHAEAAVAFTAVGDRDPFAVEARRGELLARLASASAAARAATSTSTARGVRADAAADGADVNLIARASARAREAGVPPPEIALFEAWHELVETGGAPSALAIEVLDPLTATLDTLLRAQDFVAFETLTALLERVPLAQRERRELLAEMYLRRGFATSAADEWMAVCSEQPDARALVGLARVAAAGGMAREMQEFAAAALAHDPDDRDAALLLTRA